VWDVVCLGELVIDLAPCQAPDGRWLYEPHPGGAPGNVAAGLARLGRKTAMLGTLGGDAFAGMIVAALERSGVDTSHLTYAADHKSRLTVVSLGPGGDRAFTFYGDQPADLQIGADDVRQELIAGAAVLHVGGLLMSSPQSAAAQKKAIGLAMAAGRPISVDPNFRPGLWRDRETMLRAGRDLIAQAAIVKLSEEELHAITGVDAIEDAARSLWHSALKVIAVTKGAQGADLFTAREKISCRGFAVHAVDTTAAGDAFMASLLSGLLDIGMDVEGKPNRLADILRSACAAGALCATRSGAMASLPNAQDIARLLTGAQEAPG
jgi:fructokinase